MEYPAPTTYPGLDLFPSGWDSTITLPPPPPESLGVYVEIVKPTGRRYRWDGGYRAADTPQNLSFGSKRNTGFDTLSVTLPRDLALDWPDLELFDDLYVYSVTGDCRWHGRVVQVNRSSGESGDEIQVDAVGWMAHMEDQKQPLLYVNQDVAGWEEMPQARRVEMLGLGATLGNYTVVKERGLGFQGDSGSVIPNIATAEAWYDAGPYVIAKVIYRGTEQNTGSVEAAQLLGSATESPVTDSTALTLDDTLRTATPTTPRRFSQLRVISTGSHTPASGSPFARTFKALALYADHGLTTWPIDADTGDGLYGSDVLRHMIANYCPRLNADGVEDHLYPIPHLAWPEPTTAYQAALQINGFALWELAVWEDHTVHWGPLDLTDWDWEVRTDDEGVDIDLQGDSAADLVNGAIVHYDQLPGRSKETLYPSDDPGLRDDSEDHPINRHSLGYRPVEVTPSFPMVRATAVEIGRIALAEAQQARRPGTINATGYVRDRQGNLQPGSKVRAGQRIKIVNIPGDVIRPIGEARWDQDTKKLTLGVDSSIERLEAFYNRVDVNLLARGLAA